MMEERELRELTNGKLLEAHWKAMREYESWKGSSDGSDGAFWCAEVLPIRQEINRRRKWKEAFRLHCDAIFEERGDIDGSYCCGYHWSCDRCYGEIQHGCADCVETFCQILEDHGVVIDYDDYDFPKWEKMAEGMA